MIRIRRTEDRGRTELDWLDGPHPGGAAASEEKILSVEALEPAEVLVFDLA